jgi:hypothetical protein
VRLSSISTAATVWPIVPAADNDDDDDDDGGGGGTIGGMRIGKGNRSNQRK